jgi:hypothetical protein
MYRFVLPLALAACVDATDEPPVELTDRPAFAVFPSADLVQDGRIVLEGLPSAETPIPVERLAWRDGFSSMQTVVLQLDVAVDPASLPGIDHIGTPGSVQLWDLTDGVAVPCFAEVDAWPTPGERAPAVLVRPQLPIPPGHTAAVVVTSDVRDDSGDPLSVGWFDTTSELATQLNGLGLDDIVLAESWPVATDATATTTALIDAVPVPDTYTLDEVTDTDLPVGVWKRIRGTYTTPDWLGSEGQYTLGDDGLPVRQGDVASYLYIHIPESVRDAEPGTVPVWVFGHGIFASPDIYLDDEDDPSGVIDLSNRAGAIVVASVWRGLTTSDAVVAARVGSDIGQMPQLTDKLGQGVANAVGLARLLDEGDLLDDPVFEGLADRGALRYFGISLGGILGALLNAEIDTYEHAVLHVGGSTWSTMLERSLHWSTFEALLTIGIPDPNDRQLLYSVTQLWWDPVDPINYASGLTDRSVLWQIAIGDDQVPNLTSWSVAAAADAKLVGPASVLPPLLETAEPGAAGPAVTQFDPGTFNHEVDNRPSPQTRAHNDPRLWDSMKQQTMAFLDAASGGIVEHYCDGVCGPPAE